MRIPLERDEMTQIRGWPEDSVIGVKRKREMGISPGIAKSHPNSEQGPCEHLGFEASKRTFIAFVVRSRLLGTVRESCRVLNRSYQGPM